VAELRAEREALGLWSPPGLLREPLPPVPPAEEPSALRPDAPRRRRRAWGIDEIRAGLILAVQERRRRGVPRLTQALLKEIARTSTVCRRGRRSTAWPVTTTSAATTCSEKPSERSP
jgi:hypothetical protein